MEKALTYINGYAIVAYSAQLCRSYRIPYPTFAVFYKKATEFNPTFEECSFGSIKEIYNWCLNN